MKHTRSYIENHPRPQWTRPTFVLLDGPWSFAFDKDDIGRKKGYMHGLEAPDTILVPYAHQSPKSGIANQNDSAVVWYEKIIDTSITDTQRLLLHLEGSDYETEVYVNGVYVGLCKGGYHRHTLDITTYARTKTRLVFRIKDGMDATQPRGKQRWMPHAYECFYLGTTGLYKSVWLETVPKTYLKHARYTPDIDHFKLDLDIEVAGLPEGTLKIDVHHEDTLIHQAVHTLTRERFHLSLDMTTDTQTMKLFHWSPEQPHLYDLTFTLSQQGQSDDVVRSYVGMRRIETRNTILLLNNQPLYLKMVLDQGYFGAGHLTATEGELAEDVKLMKQMGFNGVRKHEKIEDGRFAYYADVLGLLVWIEMPSAYEFREDTVHNIIEEWRQIVRQHVNHPAVMAWVVMNESWGVYGIKSHKKMQHFTETLYHLTHTLDGTRPVISNDGWEHTKSDLVTMHNYAESYAELASAYDFSKHGLLSGHRTQHMQTKLAFAGTHTYDNQPLILSEFGGIAFKKDAEKGWGYGHGVQTPEDYLNKLSGQMQAIRDNPAFSGYCITQLTDVQQEVNGLLDEARQPKVPLEAIKKLNDAFPKR